MDAANRVIFRGNAPVHSERRSLFDAAEMALVAEATGADRPSDAMVRTP